MKVPNFRAVARDLLSLPLGLAHVGNRPLALQDVTFVMQVGKDRPPPKPTGDRLPVLGVFSLPVEGQPLDLRRQRYSLEQQFKLLMANGSPVELRTLQYGVTRSQLKEILEEDAGWDAVHIVGHGEPGRLLLENEARSFWAGPRGQ
jgi:hypothetical protein